jgi:lipopolysaccharide/colanic/teichoic acid biosynthesis glycosyltransferase
MVQRFFDIVFSFLALMFISPILLVIAVALRITGNKVFYMQERVGLHGKIFKVFKFTTMRENSENMGAGTITLKDDPRVLPIGKFLRKSKLNELPQLINILKGDMSLIGPRPQDIEGFNAFIEESRELLLKFDLDSRVLDLFSLEMKMRLCIEQMWKIKNTFTINI